MVAVSGQVEEIEHLRSSAKSDGAVFLPERQSGDPDGDEPILAERQSVLRMADHVEKKPAAATGMGELGVGGAPQGNPAEDKGTRVVGEVLFSILTLLAYEHHGFEPLQTVLGDADGRQESAHWNESRNIGSGREPRWCVRTWNVTKPYQNASSPP